MANQNSWNASAKSRRAIAESKFWKYVKENCPAHWDFTEFEYQGSTTFSKVICAKHGEFKTKPTYVVNGNGCKGCGVESRVKSRRVTVKDFLTRAKNTHGRKYSYPDLVFSGVHEKIEVVCPIHGSFYQKVNSHLSGKGCLSCANDGKRERNKELVTKTWPLLLSKLKQMFPDLDFSKASYRGFSCKIKVVCPAHGPYWTTPGNMSQGYRGCQQCGVGTSRGESEVLTFIKKFYPSAGKNRVVLGGKKEIDIYIPELKVGIEFHGLWWHREGATKTLHREKWQRANVAGVRLIQIFEDEWYNKKEAVTNRLLSIIGASKKIGGRKTEICEVSPSEAKLFLEKTHSQGAGRACAYYGLRYRGSIVAVASFDKARTGAMTAGSGVAWEVIRYASKGTVVGGFSKLFNRFLTDYQPESVVSYCDLRYGDGRLYKACGFELDGITDPDYWWVYKSKNIRIPRYQTQKHKLPTHPILKEFYDPNKSEAQICHDAGWYRIYGVGHQRWIWTPST